MTDRYYELRLTMLRLDGVDAWSFGQDLYEAGQGTSHLEHWVVPGIPPEKVIDEITQALELRAYTLIASNSGIQKEVIPTD